MSWPLIAAAAYLTPSVLFGIALLAVTARREYRERHRPLGVLVEPHGPRERYRPLGVSVELHGPRCERLQSGRACGGRRRARTPESARAARARMRAHSIGS